MLAVLRAEPTRARASTLAEQMVEFDGLGHSAAIHTEDDAAGDEFGSRVKAVRIIRELARLAWAAIGDIYNAFVPVADPGLRLATATTRCPTTSPR